MELKQKRKSRKKFPPWMKKRIPAGGDSRRVRQLLQDLHLTTVCQNAHCPNMMECFSRGTATFMIMGSVCTRNCGFCAVEYGQPQPLDHDEPERVAEAASRLKLRHVVVTSVTRDDLPDGGASHFCNTIRALYRQLDSYVEVLTPDFRGDKKAILMVASERPTIYNHNLETVPRLYEAVRPQADYGRSLRLLDLVRTRAPGVFTKSGLMLGLGEERGEVIQVMHDLRRVGCDIVTLGQYLQPSPRHLPVKRFVSPKEFAQLGSTATQMGFRGVASAPFVRSSYNACDVFAATHRSSSARASGDKTHD